MQRANAVRWERWREAARQQARIEFKRFRSDPLFVAGVMLYWGEGDKIPNNPVRVSNTDSRLLRVYVRFLLKYGCLPDRKIRAHLIRYSDLDEQKCVAYWSRVVGIRQKFFYKTQLINGKPKNRRSHHGICVVGVSSRQLKEKLLIWIQAFAETL
ncbi:MAG: hypothetical protein AAB844_01445 [Patescibacteria group bacterium]